MSRSRKHTPAGGCTGCRSEKQEKRRYNRAIRRHNRQRVHIDDVDGLILKIDEYVTKWEMGKDGRHWFGDWASGTERQKKSPWSYYDYHMTDEQRQKWDAREAKWDLRRRLWYRK